MTTAPYRIIRIKLSTRLVLFQLVRTDDGWIVAQSYGKGNAIIAPQHLRDMLTRLNTSTIGGHIPEA